MVVVVNACAALLCGPARAETALAAQAGYAFRSHQDGRNHGANASIAVDIPVLGPVSLRPEGFVLGFGGSDETPASLALAGCALSLVYRIDDLDVRAHIAGGPLAGLSVEGSRTALRAGALLALGLRFPVLHGIDLEAKVGLPVVAFGPLGIVPPGVFELADGTPYDFPLQATFALGFAVDPFALLAGAAEPSLTP